MSNLAVFPEVFLVSNTESESEMFIEILPNHGSQKYASYFTCQVENKLFKASVLWMNDSRIHQDMKIARNDSAVKLGYSDWCGLPLNASERISEQALIFSLEGCRSSSWGLLHCDDRRSPWWANRDGPQRDRSRSDTGMISMNFNGYTNLVIFSIFLFCFWSRNFTYYKKVSCVWFLLLYISLQSN